MEYSVFDGCTNLKGK